jgi:hypothetical protein
MLRVHLGEAAIDKDKQPEWLQNNANRRITG